MTIPNNTAVLGIEVPIGNIEKELRLLWEADQARTNASLMNFAIYSEQPGSLVANSEIIGEITREHACRAILIELDKDAEEASIRAWITAHCHLAHGQKSVCCEQIAFHLTGTSRGRFRNSLFSHLQSDLPLVFWWQGEFSSMYSEGLYRRIDRLVYDSSSWENLTAGYEKIIQSLQRVDLVVQDLAWTRTYHFRMAIASLYDDPIALNALPATQRIKIHAHSTHRVSALMLLAWICEMAGWTRSEDLFSDVGSENSFRYAKPNGDLVDVEITLSADCAPVASVEIISPSVKLAVSRKPGGKTLHHQLISDGHSLDVHGIADSDKPAELVADQLSRGGKNSLFRRILPSFIELI